MQQKLHRQKVLEGVLREMEADGEEYLTCQEVASCLRDEHGIDVCASTVNFDLHDLHYGWRPPTIVPFIKERDAWLQKRLDFAAAHVDTDARRLIFTDECMVRASGGGTRFTWCSWGTRPPEQEMAKYSASCHVWGAIGYGGRRLLITLADKGNGPKGGFCGEDYGDMLKKEVWPEVKKWKRGAGKKLIWMQDGAALHKTAKNKAIIANTMKLELLENWPPNSPDLNPIENLWGLFKRSCGAELRLDQSQTAANKERLWNVASEWFKELPDELIDILILSFAGRTQNVNGNGGQYLPEY